MKLPMASGQGSPPVMWKSVTKALSKHCLPRPPPPHVRACLKLCARGRQLRRVSARPCV